MDNDQDRLPEVPGEDTYQDAFQETAVDDSASWTASEFISHEKDTIWYVTSATGLLVVSGLVYMFTRGDLISVVAIIVIGILFIVLAHKKPRELPYTLDSSGVTIDSKHYPYAMFKSFAVHREGVVGWVNLLPLRRFMPELSIYYPPDQEEAIINILANYLPHDQRKEAGVDRLAKRLRF